jgi:hypothetical protein
MEGRMQADEGAGLFETVARIVSLGGAPSRGARVAEMRARFEQTAGAFTPDDPWFEERSRAFWCDAVTRGRFGREVIEELGDGPRRWLVPLERAHRGLFRAEGRLLRDVWSGAEFVVTLVDDESRAELDASGGQLADARLVGADAPAVVALLPGAVFHPPEATAAIEPVLAAARALGLSTDEALDALLRMDRTFRSLARVKAAYAYRPDALSRGAPVVPVRRAGKGPK